MNACYVFFDENRAKQLWMLPKDDIYPFVTPARERLERSNDFQHWFTAPSALNRERNMQKIRNQHPDLEADYDLRTTYIMWLSEYQQRQNMIKFYGWKFNDIPAEHCEAWRQEWFGTACNDFPDWRDEADKALEAELMVEHQQRKRKKQADQEMMQEMKAIMEKHQNQ